MIILDELKYAQNYSQIIKYPNVDMVILAKAHPYGKKNIIPPVSDKSVMVHDLNSSYRQSWDTFIAHKYITTHVGDFNLARATAMVSDDSDRTPPGKGTLWINCKEGVRKVTALERVKKLFDDESVGSPEERDFKDHVTVFGDNDTNAVKNYCEKQGLKMLIDLLLSVDTRMM